MSALDLVKQEARNRIAAAGRRVRVQSLEHALMRKASGLATAATFGALARYKVSPEVAGFPWKVAVITIAQLGEGLSRGAVQAGLGGIADAATAIYVERSIATDTLISGAHDS